MKSELDIFQPRPLQTNILNTLEVPYKPLASLDQSSTIEFVAHENSAQYRDLSSIYVRFRVKLFADAEDKAHTTTSQTGPVNNVLHSLIRTATLYLNGKPIQSIDSNYSYRAYFENLLNYGTEQASVHLDSVGWALDTPGKMEAITNDNLGLKKRTEMFADSKEVELIGRLHLDMANQEKLLLPHVQVRVVLGLEKPDFYIMGKADDTSYIKIIDATMYMDNVTVAEPIAMAHRAVLQKQNAVYDYMRVECKSYTIAKDSQSISIDNIVVGATPRLLLLTFLSNKSFSGERTLNPYNFAHFDLSEFNITLSGQKIPSQPLQFDFSNKKQPIATRGYDHLFRGTNLHTLDKSCQVTKDFFCDGALILAYDLSSDASYQKSHCVNPLRRGIVGLEAKFSKPLPDTVTVLVYAEYDAQLEIDKDYNVFSVY